MYVSLRKHTPEGITVYAQNKKIFWTSDQTQNRTMRPDILLKSGGKTVVLDTKWKRPNGYGASPDDLRQLYVYLKYYNAGKAALVYPGTEQTITGRYALLPEEIPEEVYSDGSLLFLPVGDDVRIWQQSIAEDVGVWAGL